MDVPVYIRGGPFDILGEGLGRLGGEDAKWSCFEKKNLDLSG